jgi:adenylate cyclase
VPVAQWMNLVRDSVAAGDDSWLPGLGLEAGERMQARSGHILIVDDDALNRRLLTKSLENDGHRTTDVDNGFAALSALEAERPDLVLLDIVMPGLDGIEVLERMKADADFRHIPVIMISGVDDTESVVRCLESGAEDILPKPFDPAILRARIGAGLNRKRLSDLEQERVRNMFTRFLPEQIAAEMLARSDGEASIRAVRLWGTVMFVDLRGFTTFAESRPVEEVIKVLNRYQGTMSDAVLDHGGTLVSYLGDGLMAVFGVPIEGLDHADRAVAAAREMATDRLSDFNDWLRAEGIADGFRMGIGLNSGRVMSGTLGSERRIDYTVIGDTVNSAARIEQLTKQTGHAILLSDQTRTNMTGATDELVFVDEFEIRGKLSRIKLWTADEPEDRST